MVLCNPFPNISFTVKKIRLPKIMWRNYLVIKNWLIKSHNTVSEFEIWKEPCENKTEKKTDTRFFKLPYNGKYSSITQKRFKISNKFSYKDPLPFHLQLFIVYKFICANCKVCYVGETTRHLITRINEYLQKDPSRHFQTSARITNT